MKLKMTEGSEKYGAPTGLYRAKFLGAKPDTHPEYGAGLKWEFEITDGPSAGKVVGRTTSPAPTLKNGCGKMLQMLTGGVAALNEEFDLDHYIGRVFQVMVEVNSSGNGTRVGSVMPMTGNAPAPAAPAPSAPPPPAGKPAPAPAAPASSHASVWFWVQAPNMPAPERMPQEKLQTMLDTAKDQPTLDAIAVMDDAQTKGWGKAADFQMKPKIPF